MTTERTAGRPPGRPVPFRSPCARWESIDRAVHLRLADRLQHHDPEVARNLRLTSPRYSARPLEPARPLRLGTPLALLVGRGAIVVERFRSGGWPNRR